jgi:hypothetical protein
MDRITAAQVFIEVVERGSFSAAGDASGMLSPQNNSDTDVKETECVVCLTDMRSSPKARGVRRTRSCKKQTSVVCSKQIQQIRTRGSAAAMSLAISRCVRTSKQALIQAARKSVFA